jgi:oxygen-independent coproporphyrinogen-3 oxidase
LKYWQRQPYLGFGLDAHSMIRARPGAKTFESVRFSNPDDLTEYLTASFAPNVHPVDRERALEESLFLGLRLNRGIDPSLRAEATSGFGSEIEDLLSLGLLEGEDQYLRLSARGRLLSNEVFERFIAGRIAG